MKLKNKKGIYLQPTRRSRCPILILRYNSLVIIIKRGIFKYVIRCSSSSQHGGVMIEAKEVVCPPDVLHLLRSERRKTRGAVALLQAAGSYSVLHHRWVISLLGEDWMSIKADLETAKNNVRTVFFESSLMITYDCFI